MKRAYWNPLAVVGLLAVLAIAGMALAFPTGNINTATRHNLAGLEQLGGGRTTLVAGAAFDVENYIDGLEGNTVPETGRRWYTITHCDPANTTAFFCVAKGAAAGAAGAAVAACNTTDNATKNPVYYQQTARILVRTDGLDSRGYESEWEVADPDLFIASDTALKVCLGWGS